MGSLPQETEAMLWKFTALLMARGLYKKKILKIDEIARAWKISERQAFCLLNEADGIFKQLVGPILMQPDAKDKPEEGANVHILAHAQASRICQA